MYNIPNISFKSYLNMFTKLFSKRLESDAIEGITIHSSWV